MEQRGLQWCGRHVIPQRQCAPVRQAAAHTRIDAADEHPNRMDGYGDAECLGDPRSGRDQHAQRLRSPGSPSLRADRQRRRRRRRAEEEDARASASSRPRAHRGGGEALRLGSSQPANTSTHASDAACNDVVRGRSQRPIRKRRTRLLVAIRGMATMSAAAAKPAPAMSARPRRTAVEWPGTTAAARASGAKAALSISPSMKSERQSARTPAGHRRKRRTIAMRTTSSNRPGRASAVTEAAPFAAASASGCGRSCGAKSCCHP